MARLELRPSAVLPHSWLSVTILTASLSASRQVHGSVSVPSQKRQRPRASARRITHRPFTAHPPGSSRLALIGWFQVCSSSGSLPSPNWGRTGSARITRLRLIARRELDSPLPFGFRWRMIGTIKKGSGDPEWRCAA